MLPPRGRTREEILATVSAYREGDLDWKSGRTFGFVYDPGHAAADIGKEVYASFLSENGLDPTSFPSLRRLENEVVAMARAQVRGGADVVGTFTSGGTESIMLAVKAARGWAKRHRPRIDRPEMVLPVTAHAAFYKAADYLGVGAVTVPVDPQSFCADPEAIRAAITERTVLLVGSAPSYAHGVIDPIPAIAALAAERGILCHTDACVGGWLLPWFKKLGVEMPEYDFQVPGVTSISMDLHKFAFCPKGASLLLCRDAALRRHHVFANATWTGYSVVNTAVQSSKSGGPIAAAWAVMNALGDEGYAELARLMHACTRGIADGVARIPGLSVLGRPQMSLVAIASEQTSVFHVADEMKQRRWYVQPQLRRGPSPANLHLTIGPTNARWVEAFLSDLGESVTAAAALPDSPLAAQIAEMFASMDPAAVPDETVASMMGMAGAGGGGLPGRMAEVNQILNALPPPLVERALIEFMGQLFR
jgi:glutamate/tyrosine decarboxylase-like PLP-dependent enzyme